jgi:hypothetical protein
MFNFDQKAELCFGIVFHFSNQFNRLHVEIKTNSSTVTNIIKLNHDLQLTAMPHSFNEGR